MSKIWLKRIPILPDDEMVQVFRGENDEALATIRPTNKGIEIVAEPRAAYSLKQQKEGLSIWINFKK